MSFNHHNINDFTVGQRVQTHPATDWWMRGARFGTVVLVGRVTVHVKLDNKAGAPVRFLPRNVRPVESFA